MRVEAFAALLYLCPLAAAQPFGGRLAPGGHLDHTLTLPPSHFTTLTIAKGTADLQVAIRSAGAPVRDLLSTSYSVAPITFTLWADREASFEIVLTNPGRTEIEVRATLAPPRPATDRDRLRWEAEQALNGPPTDDVRLRHAAGFFAQDADPYKQASALRLLGNLYTRRQDFAAARDSYTQAAAILKTSPWRFEESVVRQNLSNAISETGDDRAAIAELDAVLSIRAELRDDLGRGITLFGRARCYWRTGELQKSLDDYRLSLTIFRKLNESRWEATVRNALGLLQVELGQTGAARASYAESLAIGRRLQDQNGIMMATNNLAMLHETLGQHAAARAGFEEAIRLCQSLGNRQAHAYILQNIADVAANEGDHPRALREYQQSLDLKQQLKDVRAAAETKRKIGLSHLATGQLDRARPLLDAALTETRSVSDRTGEAQSLAALARLESAAGSPRLAEDRIEDAVRLIETTRVELRTRDLRTSYFSTQRDFYDFAIDLAMEKAGSGPATALEWSERQRARTLLDSVRRAGANPSDPLAITASAEEIRRGLSNGEVLVEYSSGPLRTWAWVISPSQVRAVRLPGWDAIGPAMTRLRQAVALLETAPPPPQARRRLDDALKELAAQIWWPIGIGPGAARVVIAADAGLERVPFAALPVREGGPRLIEQVEIATIPSASLVAAIRRNRTAHPRHLAIFADPVFSAADLRIDRPLRGAGDTGELARLRFSREEARDLARKAGAQTSEWMDFRANLDNLRLAAAEPGAVLHLATHAIVDDRDPAASRLVVSQVDAAGKSVPGDLRINDIYNLRLRRELVVLSACRAAAGPEVRGEGMLSLTRAFLYAGAKGVVASLWRVGDRASAELMRRFYEGLLDRRRTPAEALRAAQLGMMKDARWSGVEHWAPFLFSGDWRITPWGPASGQ